MRKLCEQNCKCFTGPHSVLQIFIEKIVSALDSFAQKLRILTRDDLQLWVDDGKSALEPEEKNLNELNYSINGIDLNIIFKMQDQITVQDGIKSGLLDGINPKEQDTNV